MSAVSGDITIAWQCTWDAEQFLALDDTDPSLPKNLTGATARMMFRTSYEATSPILSLTSLVGGGLTIDGPNGVVDPFITATQAGLLTLGASYPFDCEVQLVSGEVDQLARGKAYVVPGFGSPSILRIEQGSSYSYTTPAWTHDDGTPMNLTGWTITAWIRTAYDAATSILTLTEGSGVTNNGASGDGTIALTPTQTAALSPYVPLFFLCRAQSPSGYVRPLDFGRLLILPEATR